MRVGQPLGGADRATFDESAQNGDLFLDVQARDSEVNKNSINAAVYRMATMDPPMLIRRTVDSGLVYVLASAEDKDAVFGGVPE